MGTIFRTSAYDQFGDEVSLDCGENLIPPKYVVISGDSEGIIHLPMNHVLPKGMKGLYVYIEGQNRYIRVGNPRWIYKALSSSSLFQTYCAKEGDDC